MGNTDEAISNLTEIRPVNTDGGANIVGGVNTGGGNFIGRDQYNLFINAVGPFAPSLSLQQLRRDYLEHLERSYHALDFKGIPQLRCLPSELALEEVYVPLLARPELPEGETWERRLAGRAFETDSILSEILPPLKHAGVSAPVQIEEALTTKLRVIILGDPGSGKSTLLKYLALRLAKDSSAPLPILLPLNAYARILLQRDVNLQVYLAEYYSGRAQGVAALEPLFKEALKDGRAVVLLDGLDEVQSNRAALVEKVETFADEVTQRGNRVMVSSRIVGYRDAPLSPKDWTLYTLLDFTPDDIGKFAKKWCLAFEKSTLGNNPEADHSAENECAELLEAVHANPGVGRLASNPLLLTILALIKRQGVEFPKSRIKLYDRYLETLIEAWNRAGALDKSAGRESLNYEATLEMLGPLALRIREENPTAGLVSSRSLQDWLTAYFTSEQWGLKFGPAREKACSFLEDVHRYSNLLVERGEGQFGFIHLTFEEALAAYGLISVGQVDRQKTLEIIEKHLPDPAWRETILLSIGVLGLIQRAPQAAGEVVRAILKMSCEGENVGRNVLLAGACLEDVGPSGLGRSAACEIQAALLTACRNRSLPPVVQRDVGFSLGRSDWVPADLDAWVNIPAGSFLYGDYNHKEIIEQPFAIQKYPVTNLQYRRFVDANGYNHPEWWGNEGWGWRSGTYEMKSPKGYQNLLSRRPPNRRNEPFFWHDEKWNNPLSPLVGVTWFEAEAYANWLSAQLIRMVRLPTEQEWERAARGTQGREYAWDGDFDRNKINCAEYWAIRDFSNDGWMNWVREQSGSASTTIIGQFPEGATSEGIHDLCGNIWEWTASYCKKDQIYQILRGGSWDNGRRNVRCAFQDNLVPDFFYDNLGFRLVSPGKFLSSG